MKIRYITHVGSFVNAFNGPYIILGKNGTQKVLKEIFFFTNNIDEEVYHLEFASAKVDRSFTYSEKQLANHKKLRPLNKPLKIDDEDILVWQDQQGVLYYKHMFGEKIKKFPKSSFTASP